MKKSNLLNPIIYLPLLTFIVMAGALQLGGYFQRTFYSVDQFDASQIEKIEATPHFVFVTPLDEQIVWNEARIGFEDASKDLGFRADWVGPTVLDVEEMTRLINLAIIESADGIITQGMDTEKMTPVLNAAANKGIPVVVVNSDVSKADRLAYLGTDADQVGKLGGQQILEHFENRPLKVAFMAASLDYQIGLDLIEGYKRILEKAPGGMEILAIESCEADQQIAKSKWQEIMIKHPEINLAINVAAESVTPCVQIAASYDLQDQITIVGIDTTEEILNCIRDGTVAFTMSQNFYRKGYQSSEWLMNYIRTGKRPPHLINDSGTLVVNLDNIDSFKSILRDHTKWGDD
jgi:ABC-type sugar transport system substrate-binding protein